MNRREVIAMFVRILLAMALAVMLFAGSGIDGFSIKSLRSSISDKEIETNTVILDSAIVSWYCHHSGVVPDHIDVNVIKIMGLEDMDVNNLNYTKIADNKFTLVATLSNKSKLYSANSNKDLPDLASYSTTPSK